MLYTTLYWNEKFPHISEITHEIASETAIKYKEKSINHDQIHILPLEGQSLNEEDLTQNQFWTTDPHPSLESTLLQYVLNKSYGGRTSFFGGEAKIWSHILNITADIKNTDGIELDIYNLTPIEAVFLIKEIVRRKVIYDDLLAGNVSKEKITNGEIRTARSDLLTDYQANRQDYDKKATKYTQEVDSQTADQMLDHGYLICRHISALSSIIYEILRSKQQSILMNGSYLIYHDESMGDQAKKASVNDHAFNILFVTHPEQNHITVKTSVIDNTYILDETQFHAHPDHTPGRISQCCSSLAEIGHLFDVTSDDVTKLADIAAEKIRNSLLNKTPIFSGEEISPTKTELISDYLSLLFQGTSGKLGNCLEKLFEIYQHDKKTRLEMIEDILLLPPATYVANEITKCIHHAWIPELIKQLKQIDFSQKTNAHVSVIMLIEHIVTNLTSEEVISDETGYYMDLLTEYHRISNN